MDICLIISIYDVVDIPICYVSRDTANVSKDEAQERGEHNGILICDFDPLKVNNGSLVVRAASQFFFILVRNRKLL